MVFGLDLGLIEADLLMALLVVGLLRRPCVHGGSKSRLCAK